MQLPTTELLVATLSSYASLYSVKLFELEEIYGGIDLLFERWRTDPTSFPPELNHKLHRAWQSDHFVTMASLLKKHSIHVYAYDHAAYPEQLQSLADKPYQLYVHGSIDILNRRCLSCVGTRRHSAYGKRAVNHLLRPFADVGITLVSGMALGIDGEVHQLALSVGIPTVAVLGGGLDVYEPHMHNRLGHEIAQTGCLISEYPPGVRPMKHHFLDRNRIIAGLSRATIVVEGRAVSGSLVTARYALAYGREVGAVPGDIFNANAQGPLLLLRDGAWPMLSSHDVRALLGLPQQSPKKQKPRNRVHALLRQQGQTVVSLRESLKVPLKEVQHQITTLELEGLVAMDRQGNYYLVNE